MAEKMCPTSNCNMDQVQDAFIQDAVRVLREMAALPAYVPDEDEDGEGPGHFGNEDDARQYGFNDGESHALGVIRNKAREFFKSWGLNPEGGSNATD
jgi:hypothetical protein